MRIRRIVTAVIATVSVAITAVVLFAPPASAATLTEVTGFGTNPSNLRMFLYVPANVTARPAVVVAVHYCHGDGPAFFNGSDFGRLADQYGFIVIFPSVTQASDGCFDVATTATLTHNGGSDSLGIVSMVNYVKTRYNADPNRVYATGVSSGAMMTNVLLGSYPDVFRAGSAFAGVPFGCFAVNPDALRWSDDCAKGRVVRTAQQWGDGVRAAFPGFTGARPRMQLWHGTNDEVLNYVNFGEEIKQWTNVLGVSSTPTTTEANTPQSGWTRTRYVGSGGVVQVEAISMQGVPHNLPVQAAAAIHFFGLDTTTPTSAPPTSAPPTTSRPPTSAPPTTSRPPTTSAAPTGAGGCTAAYTVSNSWQGGFVSTVRVTAGTAAISGWRVTMTLPSGTAITNLWNAQPSATSGTVTVTNMAYNGGVGAGQFTEFGFQGSGVGTGVTVGCSAT
jgi:acetylxylan esterase